MSDGAGTIADNKRLVRRLVDEVINGRQLDLLDELCTPVLAPKLRLAFRQFRDAFADWKQTLVELVAEGDTVVARFRCEGTQTGDWLGMPSSGRRMRIDEVYFFRFENGRIARLWGLEDTWTRRLQLAGEAASLGELGSLG